MKYFEGKTAVDITDEEFHKASTYVSKLELWAGTIRFKRNSEEKREFEDIIRALRLRLQDINARAEMASHLLPSKPPIPTHLRL